MARVPYRPGESDGPPGARARTRVSGYPRSLRSGIRLFAFTFGIGLHTGQSASKARGVVSPCTRVATAGKKTEEAPIADAGSRA
jgi:hypothetical protein